MTTQPNKKFLAYLNKLGFHLRDPNAENRTTFSKPVVGWDGVTRPLILWLRYSSAKKTLGLPVSCELHVEGSFRRCHLRCRNMAKAIKHLAEMAQAAETLANVYTAMDKRLEPSELLQFRP